MNSASLAGDADAVFAEAIEKGDVVTVRGMLQARPDLVNPPGWHPPPLHCAVLWNQPEIIEILLNRGADPNQPDPDRNTTPVRYAVMYARSEVIPLLIGHGADPGVCTDAGTTLWELAEAAAAGQYADYEDLPDVEAYGVVLATLGELGLQPD